ncbi:MAG TPA: peroxiredoxin [Candidatus Limnocylindrales bacterium]|nr:peroxiredoxin [Candidatus Limnocylindrales bacterium]
MTQQTTEDATGTIEPPVPAAGEPAPDFALSDADGTTHRLADRRGQWTVVYFYPEDDTPGCTTEACQFRDVDDEIRDRGADVWGISPQGAASHRKFREKFGLPFTLLSDEDHAVSREYGAWGPKTSYGKTTVGIRRSTFLVDPDLQIARAWPKVKADGHAAEVLAALESARDAARPEGA